MDTLHYEVPDCLTNFLHTSHVNRHSQVWVCRCNFKLRNRQKVFLLKMCTQMWMRRLNFKISDSLKDYLHTLHIYGSCPVWLGRCKFKFSAYLKDFLHTSHVKAAHLCDCKDDTSRSFIIGKIPNVTFKRPLPSMSAQMQLQVTSPTELFLTYITFIRPLPSMSA